MAGPTNVVIAATLAAAFCIFYVVWGNLANNLIEREQGCWPGLTGSLKSKPNLTYAYMIPATR